MHVNLCHPGETMMAGTSIMLNNGVFGDTGGQMTVATV
jgi:hypothetical protein